MNDIFHLEINIPDFSRLLLWCILISFSGLCLTASLTLVMGRFFLAKKKHETAGRNAADEYFPVSLFLFELPIPLTKFQRVTSILDDKMKETLRLNLKLHYFFMLFAYLSLLFTGWYFLHHN